MDDKDFQSVTLSVPDKENCICEINYDNKEFAELSQEYVQTIIQIYPYPFEKGNWEMNLDETIEKLEFIIDKYIDFMRPRFD